VPQEFQEYLCPQCGSERLLLGRYDGRCTACRRAFRTKDANALTCGQCGMEAGLCGCYTTAGRISVLSDGFIVAAINKADEANERAERLLEKNKKP
jgi:DNA-directed RNA polymerase subunit RPC12/RpoP